MLPATTAGDATLTSSCEGGRRYPTCSGRGNSHGFSARARFSARSCVARRSPDQVVRRAAARACQAVVWGWLVGDLIELREVALPGVVT